MKTKLIEKGIINFLKRNILPERIKIYSDSFIEKISIDSFSIPISLAFIERQSNTVILVH